MKANNRLAWKQGMLITPEILIESDNYQQFHHMTNRKLIIRSSYGLLPKVKFAIDSDIIDSDMEIKDIYCEAVTQNGNIMLLDKKCVISLPSLPVGKYYITVKNSDPSYFETNEIPYCRNEYDYEVKSWVELSNGSFFPIMKMQNEAGYWERIDYIPPCFAISSCRILKNKYDEIIRILNEIQGIIDRRNYEPYLTYSLAMLILELNNYTQNETPFEMVLLLKKILKTILLMQADLDNDLENFIQTEYDHNDVLVLIDSAIDHIQKIENALSQEKPEEKPQEEEKKEIEPDEWVPPI